MPITTNKTVYTPKDDTNSIIKKYYVMKNITLRIKVTKTYFIISSRSFHEKSRSTSGGESRPRFKNLSK